MSVDMWIFVIWLLGVAANLWRFSDSLSRKRWIRNLPEFTADMLLLASLPLSWLVPVYLTMSKIRQYDRV